MKKSNRWIALFTILAVSIVMLSSCAGGLTYEDLAGNSAAVSVPDRDQIVNVPYSGDPIVQIIEIPGDVIEVEEGQEPSGGSSNNGGETNGDDTNGGNSDNGNNNNGNGGNSDDGDDDDFEWDDSGWLPDYNPANVLRVLDQNVRCVSDVKGSDGNPGIPGTSLEERHLRIKDEVEKVDPDLMGFQEVTPDWIKYLKNDHGANYDYYYWFRASNNQTGVNGDECSAVFWKKDKFDKVTAGHFWLGDQPDQPSKFAGQTDQHRICNWVKLKNKETGKQFVFASVHYSTDGNDVSGARIKSAAVMNTQLKKVAGSLPIICVGDYNMSRNSDEYNALVQGGLLSNINEDLSYYDTERDYDNHTTSGGYKLDPSAFDENGEAIGGGIIDFIMISSADTGLYPMSYKVLQERYGGNYVAPGIVSDHFGVFAEVVIV